MLHTSVQLNLKHAIFAEAVVLCMMVITSWLSLFQLAAIVPLQDELDDILRYGAAELFADAAAANQQAQQVGLGTVKGAPPLPVRVLYLARTQQKCLEFVC